ncbi:unnamed protein product [Cylindrotheca closterium]|uniref:ETS domain-containing protein n=1 Tax=Cylindrotheca closterium TaxID=2856 RepID=A0AAD2FYF9_9STRA|nr:unnamed protein product [Cylindrotheca closterium]
MSLFPYKLHELLTEMQSNDHLSSIISWTQSGGAFKIHEPLVFEEILLQKYFPRQTQLNSFKRQLLYYGFDNLGDGIFAHPCFLKDKRHLCGQINHTNPTKSQREGKALISSRRVRGKRAKHVIRERLEASAASAITNTKKEEAARTTESAPAFIPSPDPLRSGGTTSPVLSVPLSLVPPLASPLARPGSNNRQGGCDQPSLIPLLLHSSREMPNQYWSRLNNSCAPLSRMVSNEDHCLPASTVVSMEGQNLPLSSTGISSMFPRMKQMPSGLTLSNGPPCCDVVSAARKWRKCWCRKKQ